MNYNLNKNNKQAGNKTDIKAALIKMHPLLSGEMRNVILALVAILINSGLTLLAPIIVGQAIDKYIRNGDWHGVMVYSIILFVLFVIVFVASYLQTTLMGGVGQRVLYNLRNAIFSKLQELPLLFFNQNKSGDLISRINNDTDKLNQFFSQSLMQFIGNAFVIVGAGILLLVLNWRLGLLALAPALLMFIFTRIISPWVKDKNAKSLQSTGGLSAEVQESLDNFKVVVAFNRRDYFQQRFLEVNEKNYQAAVSAGIANNIFVPVYTMSSNLGQLIVLAYGLYLISLGQFSLGLLVSYLAYVNGFYGPLRQIAALWSSFQLALASWDRISEILALKTNLALVDKIDGQEETSDCVMEFRDVSFCYDKEKAILKKINFKLMRGKTYALVGPTGGGKTTTASLMARLYDPSAGTILLANKDIRSYSPEERVKKIGFILQEPFLFTGSVRENILYGNETCLKCSDEELFGIFKETGLEKLLERFENGLDTKITVSGDSISLGQKQLIAFIRAVLRQPEILILDEATANIDTVTEKLLEEILEKLPKETTKVIIAHRLNTIDNADEIFFVNAGEIVRAGSMQQALELLLHGKNES